MPMDWDGVVEVNNRFLVFETKQPGAPIPRGQEMALWGAVLTGYFTVFIVYGKTAIDIQSFEILWNQNGAVQQKAVIGGAETLLAYTRRWFEKADAISIWTQGKSGTLFLNRCQFCKQEIPPLDIY